MDLREIVRFAVNFRSRSEGKLIFTLSAEDDPLAVAATLMPQGQRSNLAVMYQAPETMIGTYMPGAQGSFDRKRAGLEQ